MELNDKVNQLEDEIKVLKNEVQAVLLDLREIYLNRENPFNPGLSPVVSQPPLGDKEEQDGAAAGESQESEQVEEPANELELTNEPEPAEEPESAHKQEPIASEETAHEEVKREWQPEIEPRSRFKSKETSVGFNEKIGLTTMAELAQWVGEAVKQFGYERTESILDIYEVMGYLTPDLKNILVKFISPIPNEYSGKVTTRDCLASIVKLGSLLGSDNKSEAALLYILCQENGYR